MKTGIYPVRYVLLIFFFWIITNAQESSVQNFIPKALNIYPLSPEAASLGKHGELPVNLATGKINYTVPLYTIKVGDFKWPIYLSYNHGGLKTEEDPGIVGLGWDLMVMFQNLCF